MFKRDIEINEFIKLNYGGVEIADFEQIKSAIIKRYQNAYGKDIDLSNVTADGVFINDLSLIINNILESFKILYSNLDVNTASGVYLDNLCKLCNVTRKQATNSTAQLQLTNSTTTDYKLTSGTMFIDKSTNLWEYEGKNITIPAAATQEMDAPSPIIITVKCTQLGPITAPANSIYQTLEANIPLIVKQSKDAVVGNDTETDAQLRQRRNQSTGLAGVTVLESLIGSLLKLDGVIDAQIINNNTSQSIKLKDGTTPSSTSGVTEILAHSVFVILRVQEGLNVSDEIIGKIIANKMTPGINTIEFKGNANNGESKSYINNISNKIDYINQTIFWKQAKGIAPECSITISKNDYFNNESIKAIAIAVVKYLNNLKLSQQPTKNDMIINAMYSVNEFLGNASFVVTDAIPPTTANPNTFYNYTGYTTQPADLSTSDTIKIIFK